MKVLWFSNISLVEDTINRSGTWVYSMFKGLKASNDVNIVGNISFSNSRNSIISESGNLKELLVPISYGQGIDDISVITINKIVDFVESLSPDIIHIWGIESIWAAICQKRLNKYPQLIEIQGLKGISGKPIHFNGGLIKMPRNILKSMEWLLPKLSLSYIQKGFDKWDYYEQEVISHAKYINTQSNWVRDALKFHFNTNARIFNTSILLRKSFINPAPWMNHNRDLQEITPIIFSISSPIPYKGLHVLIEALSLLKKYYPNIKLRVAGISINQRNSKSSGYIRFINKLISSYGLNDNIELLGNLTEDVILQEFYKCNVFVNPTFIETFCLALAEALSVGVPTVSSYVAAIPELVEGNNGLLVPVGDAISLASAIYKILSNSSLSRELSHKAYQSMSLYNRDKQIIENQINTYRIILNS